MEYIKLLLNYTLSFYMWLVVARAIISLFTENPQNVLLKMFFTVTEPVYKLFQFLPCCRTFVIIITILMLRLIVILFL
ncbi:MAG: YggT family protein [Leptospiraceae bacterium]|nr:YggT family protein [Leptospiraceae bacterium]